jgi:hypothetical protein
MQLSRKWMRLSFVMHLSRKGIGDVKGLPGPAIICCFLKVMSLQAKEHRKTTTAPPQADHLILD